MNGNVGSSLSSVPFLTSYRLTTRGESCCEVKAS